MYFEDTCLLDLVQIGSTGSCCYYSLNTNPQAEYKFCVLTDSHTIEQRTNSFYMGMLYEFYMELQLELCDDDDVFYPEDEVIDSATFALRIKEILKNDEE